jgi:hypothetical protein
MFRIGQIAPTLVKDIYTVRRDAEKTALEHTVSTALFQARMQTARAAKRGDLNAPAVVKHHRIAAQAAAELRAFKRTHGLS